MVIWLQYLALTVHNSGGHFPALFQGLAAGGDLADIKGTVSYPVEVMKDGTRSTLVAWVGSISSTVQVWVSL